jgi:hypothetical protein
MKKFLPGHLSNFQDAQEMLGYEDHIWRGGAMSVIEDDYHSEWEEEYQEEVIKRVLAEDD